LIRDKYHVNSFKTMLNRCQDLGKDSFVAYAEMCSRVEAEMKELFRQWVLNPNPSAESFIKMQIDLLYKIRTSNEIPLTYLKGTMEELNEFLEKEEII